MRRVTENTSLDGWLISPEGNWCYRFHRDPNSLQRYPFVFVDKWMTLPDGLPTSMTKRSKMPLDEALEMCGNMLLSGWKKLENHYKDANQSNFDQLLA